MKKKILMVVGKFYPEISGGNLQCKKIIDELKNNYKFKILTFSKKKIESKADIQNYDITRIRVGNNYFDKIFRIVNIVKFFFDKKKEFSIVHIFGVSKVNMLIIFLAKIFNKKIIVRFSSYGEDDLKTINNTSKMNFVFHKYLTNILISIAPIFFKSCKELDVSNKKLKLIKNFLLINKKNVNKKKKLEIQNNFKNVLCIGHFSKDKRNDLAFEIWKESYLKGFKSNIIFVGNSSIYNHEVDQQIKKKILYEVKKFKLTNNVYFIEFENKMDEIYKNSDILLMPSIREGVPNSLLEALHFGLDCICTKLPSIKNFLNFDNLSYIDMHEKKLIWSKELIKQLKKKKKKKINRLVSLKFNNKEIKKEYYHLYKNL